MQVIKKRLILETQNPVSGRRDDPREGHPESVLDPEGEVKVNAGRVPAGGEVEDGARRTTSMTTLVRIGYLLSICES